MQPAPVVEASISVIGVVGNGGAGGRSAARGRLQLQSDVAPVGAVADELRAFFKGVEGANLVRR